MSNIKLAKCDTDARNKTDYGTIQPATTSRKLQRISCIQDDDGNSSTGTSGTTASIRDAKPKCNRNNCFHHLRWIVMMLASVNIALTFVSRLGITIAIVRMVNQTVIRENSVSHMIPDQNLSSIDDNNINTLMISPEVDLGDDYEGYESEGEFEWNYFVQSLIINIYFVGYALPQLVMSLLARHFGVYRLIIVATSVSVISLAITPSLAHLGWPYLFVNRLVLGVANSAAQPVSFTMIDTWIPAKDHTRVLTMIQFISACGLIVSPLYSGYLSSIHWTWVFYITSFVYGSWLLLWILFVRDTPEQLTLMSQKELKHITSNRSIQGETTFDWRKILHTWRFYIMVCAWACYDGTLIAFMGLLPTYFETILNINIQQNGTLSFFIQSASCIGIIGAGIFISCLTERFSWPGRRARILTFGIGAFGASLMWFLPSFIDTNVVTLFLINRAFHPAIEICIIGNVIDQWTSVGLSGTMFGVHNTIAVSLTVLFSWSSGFFLDYMGATVSTWNLLFLFYGSANIAAFVFFVLGSKQTLRIT